MKSIIIMAAVLLGAAALSTAQISNARTVTVKVYGNCGICKTTIEKAGSKNKLYETVWNADSKMAAITYDGKRTTADAVLKNIALAGYDNTGFLAPDDIYDKLQGCCKYERGGKTAAITTPAIPAGNGGKETLDGHDHGNAMNNQDTAQLKAIFDNYFALKDALVKTDGDMASAKATALLAALEAVDMAKLETGEHTVWMKVEKQLKNDALHIKENKDVEHQRGHFVTLSSGMYELVKASGPAEVVYYQHCPMANDGKGANWLSRESSIKNPYYGSQMLSCGKTVETIRQ